MESWKVLYTVRGEYWPYSQTPMCMQAQLPVMLAYVEPYDDTRPCFLAVS